MIPDLADPSKVYVTTFGGSVWHGPATGDPAAVEDVVRDAPAATSSRLEQLVDGNVLGVHAYEVKLARASGNFDPTCWSSPPRGAASGSSSPISKRR